MGALVKVNQSIEAQVTSALLNDYISYLDTTEKTISTYQRALRLFFEYMQKSNISKPTRNTILDYKAHMQSNGLKATTIQNYITAIKLFFKWTAFKGLYPNIAEHLKGAKISREHKKDYLTSSQTRAVLDTIKQTTEAGSRDYAILLLMVTTGLRTIEVSRANIEDIKTAANNAVLYIHGKGRSDKSEFVILPNETEQALRAYLSLRGRGNTATNEPLFTSTSNNKNGERLSTRTISGIVKKYLVKAGYQSERLTAHSLRHTAVTLSLLAGEKIEAVQQFARHKNITTTMIYNHALELQNNGCSRAISGLLFQ